MMTLRRFSQALDSIPTGTAWYLADLGRAMGKQELFTRQSPQRLKALREHALVESAVSSNRIEGVEVEPRRVATLVFGRPSLRDRNEEEVRGCRDALKLIHEGEFRLVDIERACPGITREWIRRLLANMKAAGEVSCQGKGLAARWRFLGRKGSTLK